MMFLPITATEARKYADESKPSAIRKEYYNLRQLMSDRIADGRYDVSISPDELSFMENRERLINEGFRIMRQLGKLIISWQP